MAEWVNLLEVLYPIGSLYLSRIDTSPASTIGGSWTQIKGAVLAAHGANGYTLNNYGGSLNISIDQMPAHNHDNMQYYRDGFPNPWVGWISEKSFYTIGFGPIPVEGGGNLLALPLWSLYLVQNCLIKEVRNGLR